MKNRESWENAYGKLNSRLWGDYPLTCLASRVWFRGKFSCGVHHLIDETPITLGDTAAHLDMAGRPDAGHFASRARSFRRIADLADHFLAAWRPTGGCDNPYRESALACGSSA